MNEQQIKWRAVVALRQSPYSARHDESGWGWRDDNGVLRSIHLGYTQATVLVPISDIPVVLNPITKERLETVVRSVLDGYVTQAGDYEVGRMYGGLSAKHLADTVIAHFFPEEATTDANPTGGIAHE